MPHYRRHFVQGGTFFFTVVTHERLPILTTPFGRACLRNALQSVKARLPFELFAVVLLPDHLHAIWILPRGDSDYATRWTLAKESFTRAFLADGGTEGSRTISRARKRERGVWQRRYWEHTVRDDADLERCADYVHWNPVKHGLVRRVADYPWSAFHRFVRQGQYDPAWGSTYPWPDTDEWE